MTAAAQTIPGHQNTLHIQKSHAEYRQEVEQLSACAWHIAYTALWNTLQFAAPEMEKAKGFILDFLQQGKNHKEQYREFVQRVLLARQYISSHPGTYIPVPSHWFNTENTKGFSGTAKWYNSIQLTRAALPLYKDALKWFPEAVLKTTQSYQAKDFHYWRSYFIDQKANGLLNLYLSTIANCCLSERP